MSAIPTSDMPGHKKLHERVYVALGRCQESRGIEFKRSAPWDDLKMSLIQTIIAMGNLRDGGIIVIGLSEKGDKWDLTGIESDHLSTYDVDNIIDAVNKYASPPIYLDVVTVEYRDNKKYLTLQVHEFMDTPFVCKNNGPDNNKVLCAGGFYVRPTGKPRTKKVSSAEEMHDLLELASEKRAREILEMAHRIGLKPAETATQRFVAELGGL